MAASSFGALKKKPKKTGRNKWKRKLLAELDLPQEACGDVLKLTMLAKTDLLIENHSGLFQYTDTVIRLYSPEGLLRIEGKGFSMAQLGEDRAYIKGTVHAVVYEN